MFCNLKRINKKILVTIWYAHDSIWWAPVTMSSVQKMCKHISFKQLIGNIWVNIYNRLFLMISLWLKLPQGPAAFSLWWLLLLASKANGGLQGFPSGFPTICRGPYGIWCWWVLLRLSCNLLSAHNLFKHHNKCLNLSQHFFQVCLSIKGWQTFKLLFCHTSTEQKSDPGENFAASFEPKLFWCHTVTNLFMGSNEFAKSIRSKVAFSGWSCPSYPPRLHLIWCITVLS